MTPEGKIKEKVKKLLAEFKIEPAKDAGKPVFDNAVGWYYMPAQNGYGVKSIPDFLGHFHAVFWSVETKAPGKEPTGFQKLQVKAIIDSGGCVFIIDSDESLNEFAKWLERIEYDLGR